jgi:Na+/H+-dicarboxylate symporter
VSGQTHRGSAAEAVTNTLAGMVIAFVAQCVIAWANNMALTLYENFVLTFWMTIISIARNYVIRRWFNKRTAT